LKWTSSTPFRESTRNQNNAIMNSSVSNVFSPALLKAGDDSQRSNWAKGKGSSIFVKWIPDELDETIVRHYFSSLGNISKIEFENENCFYGRNMFVHFSEWSPVSKPMVQHIANAYPKPYEFPVRFQKLSGKGKYAGPTYCSLECYIDMRPTPLDKDAEIAELKTHVEFLQDQVKKMKIEVLQRDEMFRELLDVNREHGRDLQLLKEKYEPAESLPLSRPYVRCPFSEEDIAVDPPEEEPCCFEPCDTLDLSAMDFIENHDRWNTQVVRHGLPDRHLKPNEWISESKREAILRNPEWESYSEPDEEQYDEEDYDGVEDRGTNGWRIEQSAADNFAR